MLQVYEKKRTVRWKYDLGRKKNFEQVITSRQISLLCFCILNTMLLHLHVKSSVLYIYLMAHLGWDTYFQVIYFPDIPK